MFERVWQDDDVQEAMGSFMAKADRLCVTAASFVMRRDVPRSERPLYMLMRGLLPVPVTERRSPPGGQATSSGEATAPSGQE